MKKVYNLLTLILLMAIAVPFTARAATETYTFTNGSWNANPDNWTGTSVGFLAAQGLQFTTNNASSYKTGTSPTSYSNISSIVVTYSTNDAKGAGTIKVQVGSGNEKTFSVTKPSSGGKTDKNTTFSFDPAESGEVKLSCICTANSVYIKSISITYDDGGSTPTAPTITATAGGSSLSNGGTTTALPTVAISFPSGSTNVYYNVGTSASIADPTSDSNTGSLTAAGNVNYTFTAGNTYYIKARSYNAQGYSETTTSFSFTYNLPSPPSAPSITGVTDGETVSSAPNLSVSFPSGADHVYYTIGIGSQPSDPTSETNDGSFTSAGTIPASTFTTSGTYYVKVIAKNAGGYSSVSTISFTYNKPANQWLYGDTKTLWKESWDGLTAGSSSDQNAPATCSISGAESITYAWSGATHYIISATLAGGTTPELIFKGTWTVTIPIPTALTLPAELTLTYRSNNTNSSVSATGATLGTVSRDPDSGAGVYTIPVTVAAGATEIIFTFTSSSNTRLEDFLLEASSSSTLDAPVLSGITDGGTISSATDISVSFPTGATHVYYKVGTSSSLADPTEARHDGDLTAAGTIPASTFSSDGTYYVKAVAYDGTNYSSIVTLTFTISAPVTGDSYTLLSTQAAFESAVTNGDDIIIAAINNGTPVVLGAFNTNKFDPGDGTYAYDSGTNTIIVSNAGTAKVWTVEGNSTDGYTFKSGSNYLNINTSSTSNNVSFPTSSQDLVVSISSGNAAIYPSDRGNTSRQMYYYTSSSKFGNYTSSGSIGVGLYAKASTTCAVPVVSPDGGNFIGTQAVTITSTTGSTIHYKVYKNNPACDDSEAITQSGTLVSGSSFTLTDATGNAAYYVVAYASKSDLDDSALSTPVMFSAGKPATPTVSPTTVTLNSTTTYTFTTSTEGATVYYTTDGSDPTTSNNAGSGAGSVEVTLSNSATVKAVAYLNGIYSEILEKNYTFTVGAPTFSPTAGEFYTDYVDVTISSATSGATIYYTTDGSEPTTSSDEYSTPVHITHTTTIKALAVFNGQSSTVTTGQFKKVKAIGAVTVWSEDWTGGTTATSAEASAQPTSLVNGTGTVVYDYTDASGSYLRADNYATGTSPELFLKSADTWKVTVTLPAGTIGNLTLSYLSNNNKISVSTSTSGATIGTAEASGNSYTYPITLSTASNEIVLEFAASGNTRLDNINLTIVRPAVSDPEITPAGGTYNETQTVTINESDDDVTVYYTTDGTDPSASKYTGSWSTTGGTYSQTVNVSTTGTTIKAIAIDSEDNESDISEETYVLKVGEVKASTGSGEFSNPFKLTLSQTPTSGATIYYTTDGTDPASSATRVEYTTPYLVDETQTIKAVAVRDGFVNSEMITLEYVVLKCADPYFALPGGDYVDATRTLILCDTEQAEIYYTITTDGTEPADPDKTSTAYETGTYITLPVGTVKVKAVAYKGTDRCKNVVEATYNITQGDLRAVLIPGAGIYVQNQTVKIALRHQVGNAIVQYTITSDGTEPADPSGTSALTYDDATGIVLTPGTWKIRVYAIDEHTGTGSEATTHGTYTIGVQAPEFTPLDGSEIVYKGDQTVEIYSTTPGATIYYTLTSDTGSDPDELTAPEDPTNASPKYTDPIAVEAGKVYYFKAIAYAEGEVSGISEGKFKVTTAGTGLENIEAMHALTPDGNEHTMDNPMQIIWISTYMNGTVSGKEYNEFAYVRDNSGYGQIYFHSPTNSAVTERYTNAKNFQIGDWIAGGSTTGLITVWSNGFGNQIGTNNRKLSAWPDAPIGHTDILPERVTVDQINEGYDANTGTIKEDNLWGHYVHVKNLTISGVDTYGNVVGSSSTNPRMMGIATDPNGNQMVYYDSFYLHSIDATAGNHTDWGRFGGDAVRKDNAYFNAIPGRTWDIIGLVGYYNGLDLSKFPSYFEIVPIDFEYTDEPTIFPAGGEKTQPVIVKIDFENDVPYSDIEGSTIYYKTSDMEDYEIYSGPFDVNKTTTVWAYSSKPSKYGDALQSVVREVTYTFSSIEKPVITPATRTFQKDEAPLDVTISCDTGNATIWYTLDGTDPATSETRLKYIPEVTELKISETTTVRAIATSGAMSSEEATPAYYTLVRNNGVEFELVTSASQLIPGRAYVIVNRANNVALNITQTEINRRAVAVTLVEDAGVQKVQVNDDVAIFTLGGSEGAYTFFTNTGDDAAAHGYLYTQTMTNTLLTRASVGSDGFAEADITIDATTHDASIEFGGANRYLYYYKRDNLFSTYNKSTQQPVALYWRAVTDLADIVNNGTVGEQYVVNDDLVGVFVPQGDQNVLYAKDFNKSRRPSVNEHGAKDYIGEVMGPGKPDVKLAADYDQSTWVKIVGLANPSSYEGKTIIGGTLVVTLTDKVNPTITKTNESSEPSIGEAVSYSRQTYIPASFMGEYMTAGHGIEYFFVVPKPQEYVRITAAVYDGTKFIVPEPSDDENKAELTGGFDVDWTLMTPPSSLEAGNEYDLEGIVEAKTGGGAGARRKAMSASSTLKLVPTNIQAGGVLTGIDGVSASRKAVRTRYYNISGMESDKPFQGVVNIIVVTYDDGSTFSRKVLF